MNQIINEVYSDLSFYYAVRNEIKEHQKFYNNLIKKTGNESKIGKVKDGICFVGWFLVHSSKKYRNVDDVAADIVDQPNDNKIDAIVETAEDELYIIQCKFWKTAETYTANDSGLKNVEELWNRLIGDDSFDSSDDFLESRLELIKEYINDPTKRIVICLVIATDLVSGENGTDMFNELKNEIDYYDDFKYELLLYNEKSLKPLLNNSVSCVDY